jgi:3-methyladenine DNA glycosylase AlkD
VIAIKRALHKNADKNKAKILQRFFKTGPGEYAQGDIFLGINVPVIRGIAKQFVDLSLSNTVKLLRSPIHEERLLALVILVCKYRNADSDIKKEIYTTYLKHTRYINNWDLVDLTAKYIVGDFLFDKDRKPIYCLAQSESLWERRIAIISTFYFIERRQFDDTLKIAKMLLADEHDLIHKAVGWMLREVGKRDIVCEEKFLKEHLRFMPRTTLRYAIERFPQTKRLAYLAKPF